MRPEVANGLGVMPQHKLLLVINGVPGALILVVEMEKLSSMDGAQGHDGMPDRGLSLARLEEERVPEGQSEESGHLRDGPQLKPFEVLSFVCRP